MHHFKVTGMSCGHCVSAIEKAVKGLDPQAEVSADVATGEVSVNSNTDAAAISDVIREAGYENQTVNA
ncbi:heavy-metal-associated domain-containing protein [Marinobacterium sp. AK62]|uniref:Heavy-metal-associated domain-containing protein n=1 Tax=Marinobacterium alkalitolerans TaxID=1542925 RepID=A0ABS3ZA98_9GAMM|nr:heavy-metal-associated domain-containing protein [Marinobacterium alkalitolerans]MBP0048579.1 heavy-metal-associated domain-containing protein [Marinobacterium alkalitolerans]